MLCAIKENANNLNLLLYPAKKKKRKLMLCSISLYPHSGLFKNQTCLSWIFFSIFQLLSCSVKRHRWVGNNLQFRWKSFQNISNIVLFHSTDYLKGDIYTCHLLFVSKWTRPHKHGSQKQMCLAVSDSIGFQRAADKECKKGPQFQKPLKFYTWLCDLGLTHFSKTL